jgi:hypothetical protein
VRHAHHPKSSRNKQKNEKPSSSSPLDQHTHQISNLFFFTTTMSLRFLSSLNSPPIVLATGAVLVAGLPFVQVGALSLGAMKIANLLAFATNVTAVSIPGRMDGEQDRKLRQGDLNPELTPLLRDSDAENNIVTASRDRTLLAPAGWAFSIWGPIYLGELVFVGAQFVDPNMAAAVLPSVTVPFVAANLLQSLWCASFRPSYSNGWHKYVSVAMLGGTAVALSQIPFAGLSTSMYLLPMTLHFGWTTAATLVNLNGSIAMGGSTSVSDSTLISTGHASAALATGLGVGVTVLQGLPAYGLTIAWALVACANGMRIKEQDDSVSDALHAGSRVQRALLWTGSGMCMAASVFTFTM